MTVMFYSLEMLCAGRGLTPQLQRKSRKLDPLPRQLQIHPLVTKKSGSGPCTPLAYRSERQPTEFKERGQVLGTRIPSLC
jgi:hypothetical protein